MTTFTKLRSGEWGITTSDNVTVGQTVTVTKKSCETQTVKIAKIVWSGNGKSICAIESTRRNNDYIPATRNSRGYVDQRGHYEGYCGYKCPVTGLKCCPQNGPCHDCQ